MKHEKDFNHWNEIKKDTQYNRRPKYFRLGEIWWCRLGVNVGHEEDGKGVEYLRPIIVVKKFNNRLCFVVPLSTIEKSNQYYESCRMKSSGNVRWAIISQLRVVDSSRFFKRIDKVDNKSLNIIKQSLRRFF